MSFWKCGPYAIGNRGHQKVFEQEVKLQAPVEHGLKEGEPTVTENNENDCHNPSEGNHSGQGFFVQETKSRATGWEE